MDFCKCGSLIVNGSCSNKRCRERGDTDKRKGWYIDGQFLDFNKPVTYEEALKSANKLKQVADKLLN